MTDLREVNEDEVRRFLRAKTRGDECFSCGSTVWSFDGGSANIFRGWPWGRPRKEGTMTGFLDFSPQAGVAMLVMTCGNCGFQRAHDIRWVIDWLDNNPEATNADL